jgi:leader peptidase (prepilin peptidase)/N-methyltransferase
MFDVYPLFNAEFPWFFRLFFFFTGACVGSFLNVCIYRIPKGESVVFPGSHSADGRLLSWWENVPIFSWIFLRGRDRVTGQPFSVRYLLVECLMALSFLILWMHLNPVPAVCGMFFLSILAVAAFIDLDHFYLPDALTVGGALAGLMLSFLLPELQLRPESLGMGASGLQSALFSLTGMLIGAGLALWISEVGQVFFHRPAMGLGDAKLLGCVGAFCGWEGAAFALFGGAVLGSVLLFPYLLLKQMGAGRHCKGSNGDQEAGAVCGGNLLFVELPFGPLIAIAAAIYYAGASSWVDGYWAMFQELIFG